VSVGTAAMSITGLAVACALLLSVRAARKRKEVASWSSAMANAHWEPLLDFKEGYLRVFACRMAWRKRESKIINTEWIGDVDFDHPEYQRIKEELRQKADQASASLNAKQGA
jgi:hypothetical protein